MKILILILTSLLCLGTYYMLLSFQEKQELEKVAKWPLTKGQLVQGGDSK